MLKGWRYKKKLIHNCCQPHQHFSSSFCADILSTKNYKAKL
jgi:hypothetical protein